MSQTHHLADPPKAILAFPLWTTEHGRFYTRLQERIYSVILTHDVSTHDYRYGVLVHEAPGRWRECFELRFTAIEGDLIRINDFWRELQIALPQYLMESLL